MQKQDRSSWEPTAHGESPRLGGAGRCASVVTHRATERGKSVSCRDHLAAASPNVAKDVEGGAFPAVPGLGEPLRASKALRVRVSILASATFQLSSILAAGGVPDGVVFPDGLSSG